MATTDGEHTGVLQDGPYGAVVFAEYVGWGGGAYEQLGIFFIVFE